MVARPSKQLRQLPAALGSDRKNVDDDGRISVRASGVTLFRDEQESARLTAIDST